jgi:hypothetical protein
MKLYHTKCYSPIGVGHRIGDHQTIQEHVKSHQDDEALIASLSLETHLNIEADKLATEYMQEDRTHRPIAALFPSAKVQLIIKDVSITRKIAMTI